MIAAAYDRQSAAVLIDVPPDLSAADERALTGAAEWLAQHAGVTVWLTHELAGPVRIDFEAMAVSAGGPNDQVSDLNVFWMARSSAPLLVSHR